jgi:enoyl-CoA hydratase
MTPLSDAFAGLPETLLADVDRAVVTFTLNRPDQRNALDFALRSALRAAFDAFEAQDSLRCAVLTGTGTAFCAGGDLKEMAAQATAIPPTELGLLLGSSGEVSKPVIAAVNGHALAGGFRLVQDCDLVIAATTAQFGITEVKRGRGAPWAVPLAGQLSSRHMAEILLLGDPIDAHRAAEIGLVNLVVQPSEVLVAAQAWAQRIAANAPLSVRAAKQMIRLTAEHGQTRALELADELYEAVYLSEDAQEGPRAFAERRAPTWRGR